MWYLLSLNLFAKPKATSPEIPLLSFDRPGTIPQMSLSKIIRCMAICGTHAQQHAPGQP